MRLKYKISFLMYFKVKISSVLVFIRRFINVPRVFLYFLIYILQKVSAIKLQKKEAKYNDTHSKNGEAAEDDNCSPTIPN